MIREAGGRPSFKNYKTPDDKIPYPASLCVSVNEEIVHGIPGEGFLKTEMSSVLIWGWNTKGFLLIWRLPFLSAKRASKPKNL